MSNKMRVADFALTVCAMLLGVAAFLSLGPAIETRFFPVYSKFIIHSLETTPDGGSKVIFKYTKHRACAPAGIMWFIGEPGGAFRQVDLLSARPKGARVNREVGDNTSVPYVIDVDPETLTNQGFASIYNTCHPFWVTRSVIYP